MKTKTVKIKSKQLTQLDHADRMLREHKLMARLLSEHIVKTQGEVLVIAKESEVLEDWKKGFVEVEIDWKHKNLVIKRTENPEAKALEVGEAINNAKN